MYKRQNDFLGNTSCGRSLNPGGHCTVTLSFRPSAAGARSASVQFTEGGSSAPQTVPVSGKGIAGPPKTVPVITALNPASVKAGQMAVVTVTGTGFDSRFFVNATASGRGDSVFAFPYSYASPTEVKVMVFAYGAGSFTANLTITTSGGTSAPATLQVTPQTGASSDQ